MRILGIVLLVLFLLILFISIGILFFPVFYRIRGYYKDSYYVNGSVSFFYHILGAEFEYDPNGLETKYRIFFVKKPFSLQNSEESEKEESEKEESKTSKEKEPFLDFVKKWATRLKEISEDKACKEALVFLKDQLLLLLKVITPKKLKLNAAFSTGSPDTTGQVLGVLALFPIGYQNRWKIHPDFESDSFYIKCEFDIKGRFMAISVLRIILRILFDNKCRRLYHRLSGKRGGKRNGR